MKHKIKFKKIPTVYNFPTKHIDSPVIQESYLDITKLLGFSFETVHGITYIIFKLSGSKDTYITTLDKDTFVKIFEIKNKVEFT